MEPGHQEPATASPRHKKQYHKAETLITARQMEETKPGTRHSFTKASKAGSQPKYHNQQTREPDHSPTDGTRPPGTRHSFTKASKAGSQSRKPDHSQNITIKGTRGQKRKA